MRKGALGGDGTPRCEVHVLAAGARWFAVAGIRDVVERAWGWGLRGALLACELKLDRREEFAGFAVEGFADGEEGFERRQVRAAFDGGNLADAELGGGGDVLQGPIIFDPQELNALAKALAQAVLRSTAQAKGLDGIVENGAQLGEAEGLC